MCSYKVLNAEIEDIYIVYKTQLSSNSTSSNTPVPLHKMTKRRGKTCKIHVYLSEFKSRDCLDEYNKGQNKSGVFNVYPAGTAISVRCDMETDGGGWTVSRTGDTAISVWCDYRDGGEVDGK